MNLLENSRYAEEHKDELTLWIKIKDRFSDFVVPTTVLCEIAAWASDHDIETEFGKYIPFNGLKQEIIEAYQFYTGIFPKNESEMNAFKIVWGEYLSYRDE